MVILLNIPNTKTYVQLKEILKSSCRKNEQESTLKLNRCYCIFDCFR